MRFPLAVAIRLEWRDRLSPLRPFSPKVEPALVNVPHNPVIHPEVLISIRDLLFAKEEHREVSHSVHFGLEK